MVRTSPAAGVADVLREARGLIAKHGWCRNVYKNAFGEMCAAGAIRCASGDSKVKFEARGFLCAAINGASITQWNDRPRRTKEQVLEAFDRAIARAAEEERQ